MPFFVRRVLCFVFVDGRVLLLLCITNPDWGGRKRTQDIDDRRPREEFQVTHGFIEDRGESICSTFNFRYIMSYYSQIFFLSPFIRLVHTHSPYSCLFYLSQLSFTLNFLFTHTITRIIFSFAPVEIFHAKTLFSLSDFPPFHRKCACKSGTVQAWNAPSWLALKVWKNDEVTRERYTEFFLESKCEKRSRPNRIQKVYRRRKS